MRVHEASPQPTHGVPGFGHRFWLVDVCGSRNPRPPTKTLACQNSGTGFRMLLLTWDQVHRAGFETDRNTFPNLQSHFLGGGTRYQGNNRKSAIDDHSYQGALHG